MNNSTHSTWYGYADMSLSERISAYYALVNVHTWLNDARDAHSVDAELRATLDKYPALKYALDILDEDMRAVYGTSEHSSFTCLRVYVETATELWKGELAQRMHIEHYVGYRQCHDCGRDARECQC